MTTTNNTSWNALVRTVILSVPEPALVRAVRESAQRFCEETELWTFNLDRINIVASTQLYTLTVPVAQYGELISVRNVKFKETGADDDQFVDLIPLSEEFQDEHGESDAWKFQENTVPTNYWVDVVNKQLGLWPIPTVASTSGILVNAVLKPSETSTVVPSFLYTDHKTAILNGALAWLFRQKAMSFYNLNMASGFDAEFLAKCADARIRKMTGLTNRPLRVRMRKFA